MFKVTTASHPLVALRAICGLTREDVAKIAGITAAIVQNIELLRSPMPEQAARRIEAATGCQAASLMDKGGAPARIDGQPFTRKGYLNYLKSSVASLENVEAAYDDLQFRLRTLLAASGNSFLYATRRIGDALNSILQEAGIPMDTLESTERLNASITASEMTVAELQEIVGDSPDWIQWIEKHPQPLESKCKVADESYRHWPTKELPKRITIAQKILRHRFRIEFANGQRLEIIKERVDGKGISGKATPHPSEEGPEAMIPTPGFTKKRKLAKKRKPSK